MDTVDRATRSRIMSAIKSSGNATTELAFARLLRRHGLRGWRRGNRTLPGKPDFVWPRARVTAFVHGDYWHANPDKFRMPKSNRAFWRRKIAANRARDKRVCGELKARGWAVFVVWESDIKEHLRRIK